MSDLKATCPRCESHLNDIGRAYLDYEPFPCCGLNPDTAEEMGFRMGTPRSVSINLDDPELVEKVSAGVHDQWMATKHSQGVSSRLSESGEELMVPYDELSEAAKDLDRGSVRAVFAALKERGQ